MDFNINIAALTQQVFGINGYLPVFKDPNKNDNDGISDNYGTIKTLEMDTASEKSIFGTPIFDVIEFKDGNTTILKLKDAPLITCNRVKKVVVTELQGVDNSVVEIINNSNWKISIRGLLVNTMSNKKPYDQQQQLNALFTENNSHPVVSKLFNNLGISDVVLLDIEFPAIEGFMNVIPYSINAMSDEPRELRLT